MHRSGPNQWLTYLRYLRLLRRKRLRTWGTLYNAAIMESVTLGHLENEPWDTIGLAHELGVSRQTVARWVDELVKGGHLRYCQFGRANRIHPTEKTMEFLASLKGLSTLRHLQDHIDQWEREETETMPVQNEQVDG